MAEGFNLIFTKANFLFMMSGLATTVLISLGTIILSLIFGTILALLRHFCYGKWAWLSGLTGVYIEFFRCTPNILWILWIRFTIKGNPTVLAIFACTLFTTAVMAEIIRGGIEAVDKGQMEAARSLGLPYGKAMRKIILPQAFRTMMPSIINQFIITLKDTSLVSVIGPRELTQNGKIIAANSASLVMPIWLSVALFYLVVCTILSRVAKIVERKVSYGK